MSRGNYSKKQGDKISDTKEHVFVGIESLAAPNPKMSVATLMPALNPTVNRTGELNVKKTNVNNVYSDTDKVGAPNKQSIYLPLLP